MKVCKEALTKGKSVVIDNTNPTPEVRKRFIDIGKSLNVPIRCFYFDVPKETCMHNNKMRKINEHRNHLSKKVPDIPIHSFFKNHIKPVEKEGFSEIKVIKFMPGPFENDEDQKTYYSFS